MKATVVYFSSCAVDSAGKPGAFFLQELPWLLSHFDRVVMCSYDGVAEITDPRPERVAVTRPRRGRWQARLQAPFSPHLWRELAHLARDGRLTPKAAARLFMFTLRGYTLHHWARAMLNKDERVTLYSLWMSYDGLAATLCKLRFPQAHAVARGHAFDIDRERDPLNPYHMMRLMVNTLDCVCPISEDAKAKLLDCVDVPPDKLRVLAMGSVGAETHQRLEPPFFSTGVLHLVSCSALIPLKQVPLLIDALALWPAQGQVSWLHIGGGPEEAAIRAYAAKKLGACANIRYEITGTLDREQVAASYAQKPQDLFVNVSRSEGVPVSIMEAMRAGIRVVAPRVGGIPELVNESFGRLYAPEGGAKAVLEALTAMAELPLSATLAMREAAQNCWNTRWRSEALLDALFPEAKKE